MILGIAEVRPSVSRWWHWNDVVDIRDRGADLCCELGFVVHRAKVHVHPAVRSFDDIVDHRADRITGRISARRKEDRLPDRGVECFGDLSLRERLGWVYVAVGLFIRSRIAAKRAPRRTSRSKIRQFQSLAPQRPDV